MLLLSQLLSSENRGESFLLSFPVNLCICLFPVGFMTPSLVTRLETDLKAQNTAGKMCKIGLKTVLDDTTPEIARTKRSPRPTGGWRVKLKAKITIRNWRVKVEIGVEISYGKKG